MGPPVTGLSLQVEEEIPINHPYGGVNNMKLSPPKKNTFWAAVVIAVVSVLIYIVHIVAQNIIHTPILHLQLIAWLLMSVAFGLLFLGLILKDF
jgi:hypothetical protein